MQTRYIWGLLLSALIAAQSGCAMMESMKTSWHSWTAPSEFEEDFDEEEDQWDYVGKAARGDRPTQKEPEQWLRNHLMSERARDIEKNLGVE